MYRDIEQPEATSGEKIFTERIKALIFLETVLAKQIMYKLQSYLEKKLNPSILKYDFSQEQSHPFSH